MLIDSHCHLVNEDYNIDEIIEKAKENDVKYLIVSGSERDDNKLNIKLLDKYDNIFLSAGYHPSMASSVTEDDYNFLEKCLMNDRVVAVGEIGLDYHYGKEDMEDQKELFRRQLNLAKKYNKPVVIHTRDAFLDTYNILVAKQYLDLGYYLGIGGVITFKNSKLKDVIKEIGLGRVVFETDSPYLSPLRGKKNEPSNVKLVCEFVSDLLGFSFDEVAKITSNNSITLFKLNIK